MIPQKPCTTIREMHVAETFASGSTPVQNHQRFLMWNIYGIIRSYRTGEDHTMEVTFHDVSIHSEIIIDNAQNNFMLGDLNPKLVALGSQKNSNGESELLVYNIEAWNIDSRRWTQRMNPSEIIDGLCVGCDFVVVYTSRRFLRFFTANGTQRTIISTTGPLVTMCAFQRQLVTAQPTGRVIVSSKDDYEHQFVITVYETNVLGPGICVRQTQIIPLSLGTDTDSKLRWLSHSNSGCLVSMDSGCNVRIFLSSQNIWIPIVIGYDILKEADEDSLWPIAVLDSPLAQFRYVYCRGNQYPSASGKQLVPTTISWSLPVLNPEIERGKLEDETCIFELQREFMKLSSLQSRSVHQTILQSMQSCLIKMFAAACQAGRECRAAELAYRAGTPQEIQAMCAYASKKQRSILSEKVAEIGRQKMQRMDENVAQNSERNNARSVSNQGQSQIYQEQNANSLKTPIPNPRKQNTNLPPSEHSEIITEVIVEESPSVKRFKKFMATPDSTRNESSSMFLCDSLLYELSGDESTPVGQPPRRNPFRRPLEPAESLRKLTEEQDGNDSEILDFFDPMSEESTSAKSTTDTIAARGDGRKRKLSHTPPIDEIF